MNQSKTIRQIKDELADLNPVTTDEQEGLIVSWLEKNKRKASINVPLKKIIWPTREGELIEEVNNLPTDTTYKLTYPGTASTKSMVLYTEEDSGILIISKPTTTYARLEIKKTTNDNFNITINTKEHTMVLLPFSKDWQSQIPIARNILDLPAPEKRNHYPVKLFLQLGVKDPFGNVSIKNFSELKEPIDHFVNEVGSGHIIHFFGTNEAGFDRMFPDYTINPTLGGEKSLREITRYAKEKGLLTSHHFVPRIADSDWMKQNPKFLKATVKDKKGNPITELYKDHPFYVMNPNDELWFEQCKKTIQYLAGIGFDYIELDQFIYQRNFETQKNPLHTGYNKLFEVCEQKDIKYWLEGICDAYELPAGNFFQILVRDRAQLWDNHENRRGYPYGKSCPELIMSLKPNAEVAYQVITENTNTSVFNAKLETARSFHADIYDLQMSFYDEKYMPLLKTVLGHIKESMSDQIYSASKKWYPSTQKKTSPKNKNNKIAICHYSVGKTDGVSLEIDKRKNMLIYMGYDVKLIAGSNSEGADYIIPELDFNREEIVRIKENSFFALKDFADEEDLKSEIYRISNTIKKALLRIQEKENFGYFFLHNIFSHGRHISAAKAFYELGESSNTQLIAVNHDFYSVGSYAQIYQPTCDWIKKYLNTYVPPQSEKIKHVTINSLNSNELKKKSGIESSIIPDTFDFNQKPWNVDAYNSTLRQDINIRPHDLFVLQATRIVERKAIELAIDLVGELNKRKHELIGKVLYNGKRFSDDSKIVLVLAGYTENASKSYKRKLENLIEDKKIEARFIEDKVSQKRDQKDGQKTYSLWDCYAYADLITYPSIWEGWGNQFIEAIFAKKPIALFEYPVFQADIKPEGYDIISLGSELSQDRSNDLVSIPSPTIKKAADKTIQTLTDPNTPDILDKNFMLGKKYHDDNVLRDMLNKLLKDN